MRTIRSVYKAINGLKVEESYGPNCDNFFEIKDNSSDAFDWMWDSFRFGYLQGLKAAKTKTKNKTKTKTKTKNKTKIKVKKEMGVNV